MKRGNYKKVEERNKPIVDIISKIKSNHPFWGYRRVWAHLQFINKIKISKNRVYRLMKSNSLLVRPNFKLKAKRKKLNSKPIPSKPNEWWGIDMTKVMIDGFGWVYLVIVIDWYTKKIVGHYCGLQAKSNHWLEALNIGVNNQFTNGVRGQNLKLMSDNGSQPTSINFMKNCSILEIKQVFTSYGNPKGNADTERVMRTIKEELVWLNEWTSPDLFFKAFNKWILYYNNEYLHSSLGYLTPKRFEENYFNILLEKAC